MHAMRMLHQMLNKNVPQIHTSRLTALMDVVGALIEGQTLTVTGLGRSSLRNISMKHSIKQSDRLIGNSHLYKERESLYQTVTERLIGNNKRPLILF